MILYRMIELLDNDCYIPRVVCNNAQGTDAYLNSFYLSNDGDDLSEFALYYEDVEELLAEAQVLQSVIPSTDLGVQSLAANGLWYLYDLNKQIEHINDLVNMK